MSTEPRAESDLPVEKVVCRTRTGRRRGKNILDGGAEGHGAGGALGAGCEGRRDQRGGGWRGAGFTLGGAGVRYPEGFRLPGDTVNSGPQGIVTEVCGEREQAGSKETVVKTGQSNGGLD